MVGQLAGVVGAFAGQGERQRTHRPLWCLAGEPARVIHAGRHLALPQVDHHLPRMGLVYAEHHAPAAAARQHAEHQARALGRAPVDAAPHLQRPVPAMDLGRAALGIVKIRPPDERAVAKDPQVLLAAPFLEGTLQHGRRVSQWGGQIRHGFTLQSKALLQSARALFSHSLQGRPTTFFITTGIPSCPALTTIAKNVLPSVFSLH